MKHFVAVSCIIIVILVSMNNFGIWFNNAFPSIEITLDKSGVPIVDYGCLGETYIGSQRNPVIAISYAIAFYDKYNSTLDERLRQQFLNNSDWLVQHSVSKGNYSILPFYYPRPDFHLQPPWQSGMAQGKALQVLVRAHEITGDQKYLETAKDLLNAFFVEVKDGGVTYKSPQDGWWYEEYAGNNTIGPRVLNGMTHALLGIHEYYQYTDDPDAEYLFDQGVLALKNNLPDYEYFEGQYSTYDVLGNRTNIAPLYYHLAQSSHLGTLYNITGEEIFNDYHDKWTNFELPDELAQAMKFYENPNEIGINFTSVNENKTAELAIEKLGNADGPIKFRIEGNPNNQTARFISQPFYHTVNEITVTMGDEVKLPTNLEIIFRVIREGLREENSARFIHGPVNEGWSDNNNYYVGITSNFSESINSKRLFGSEDNLILRQIVIDIPQKTCPNSLEFEIGLQ